MIITKKERRLRRALKTRAHIRDARRRAPQVHRTPQHIYAQVTDARRQGDRRGLHGAERGARRPQEHRQRRGSQGGRPRHRDEAKAAGVSKVAFDRSGFQFHGRVKALADAAREAGLEF